MAVLPIVTHPHPVLREKCKKVKHVDASIQRLIDDMIGTMQAAPGGELAGLQVGIPLGVAVVEVPEDQVYVLVNPEMIKSAEPYEVEEGCLSIPGYVGDVTRFMHVTVRARDRNGREVRIRGSELLAQALQHEIDHLDGVLFIDRLESPEKLRHIELAVTRQGAPAVAG